MRIVARGRADARGAEEAEEAEKTEEAETGGKMGGTIHHPAVSASPAFTALFRPAVPPSRRPA